MTVTDLEIDALFQAIGRGEPDQRDYGIVRRWVGMLGNCEHGIPRRFCTALHADTAGEQP